MFKWWEKIKKRKSKDLPKVLPKEIVQDDFFDRMYNAEESHYGEEWRKALYTLHYIKGFFKHTKQHDNLTKSIEVLEDELRRCHGLKPLRRSDPTKHREKTLKKINEFNELLKTMKKILIVCGMVLITMLCGCGTDVWKYDVGDIVYLKPDSAIAVINTSGTFWSGGDIGYKVLVGSELGNHHYISIKESLIYGKKEE